MNWRSTWLMVGVAAALLAFIFLYERHLPEGAAAETSSPSLLGDFTSRTARMLQVRYGTKFVIGLEQTNGAWRYTSMNAKPFSYPAASLKVEGFLRVLEDIVPTKSISAREVVARKQTQADFGFDAPAIAITVAGQKSSHALRFGARTPAGDQIYLQVDGKSDIYIVPVTVLDRLPRSENDWRDTALFAIPEEKVDRFEVTRAAGGFAVQRDPTNRVWRLTRPLQRADQQNVVLLLDELRRARIEGFVTDDPKADLDLYGLQAPEAELTMASGNTSERVLFGRSPTNDSATVFARQANTTNIVLVPTNILGLLRTDVRDLRDHRLVSFAPESIDTIEVRGDETFTIKKRYDGVWTVAEAPVDTAFVNGRLVALGQMQIVRFVMDVVADFTPFALQAPRRQMTLRTTTTNAGVVTNMIVAQLEFGTNDLADTVFARRTDEPSVYTVPSIELQRFPSAAWQLRDHRVWNFSTNDVVRVEISHRGNRRQLIRQADGKWAATSGDVEQYQIEELMFRLGQLSSYAWFARGDAALAQYGFTNTGYQFSIDLKDGNTTRTVTMRFGGPNQWHLPYASTVVDGQPYIFEFPWQLLPDVQRSLSIPQPPP